MTENKYSKENAQHELIRVILALKTVEDCEKFFFDLCTPREINVFSERWRVAKLLKTDKSYREISEYTGVSTATIGKVARFINGGHDITKQFLEDN